MIAYMTQILTMKVKTYNISVRPVLATLTVRIQEKEDEAPVE